MENVNKDDKKVGVLVTDEQYLKDRTLCDKTASGVLNLVDESLQFLDRRSLFWEQTAKAKPKKS